MELTLLKNEMSSVSKIIMNKLFNDYEWGLINLSYVYEQKDKYIISISSLNSFKDFTNEIYYCAKELGYDVVIALDCYDEITTKITIIEK